MGEPKIKHAKKPEAFFREVWRQSMCGYSTSMIAKHLSTSVPTVRRTLKRIRHTGLGRDEAGCVTDPLYIAAAQQKIPNFLSWERYIGILRQFYFSGQALAFADFHACVTDCPIRLSPRKFTSRYIAYRHVHGKRYTINLLHYKDAENLKIEREKFQHCRYCYLKDYRDPFFAIFQADNYLFLTLMFTLSRYRFRDMSEFEVMTIYMETAVFGMVHEILLTYAHELGYQGMPQKQVYEEVEAYFIKITDETFDQILIGL